MADDIDIEEHDLLENPRFKDILTSTQIKTELEDIEDDQLEENNEEEELFNPYKYEHVEEETHLEESFSNQDFSEMSVDSYPEAESPASSHLSNEIYHHKNKIILGSKPCPKNQSPIILGTKPTFQDRIVLNPQSMVFGIKPNIKTQVYNKPCPKSRKSTDVGDNPILKSLLSAESKGPIILGSKSCAKPKRVPEDAVVKLEDWSERLQASPCYCEECGTLFATRNALDAHNMTAHSFLVAMEAPEVLSPKVAERPKEKGPEPKYCNQCQTYFTDDNLLIQHLYEHLTGRSDQMKARSEYVTSRQEDISKGKKKTGKLVNQCSICYSVYIVFWRFHRHMTMKHHVPAVQGKKVPFGPCKLCNRKYNDIKAFNTHVAASHPSLYEKKMNKKEGTKKVVQKSDVFPKMIKKVAQNNVVKGGQSKISKVGQINVAKGGQSKMGKVGQCNIAIGGQSNISKGGQSNIKGGKITKTSPLNEQTEYSPNIGNTSKFLETDENQDKKYYKIAKFKCTICYTYYVLRKSAQYHVKTRHPRRNSIVQIPGKKIKCSPKGYFFYQTVLPLNILFQCTKCETNLLSAATVKMHSSKCQNTHRYKHKCSVCQKFVRPLDKDYHYQQHKQYSGPMKSVTFTGNIYDRVLLKCSDCITYFDESKYVLHKHDGCSKNPAPLCSICKIHVNAIEEHELLHNEYAKSDFVLIDKLFTPVSNRQFSAEKAQESQVNDTNAPSTSKNVNLKRKLPPPKTVPAKVPKMDRRSFLYYCKTCGVYSKFKKVRNFHIQKFCLSQSTRVSYCSYCGLRFRIGKPSVAHKEEHMTAKIKFKDFVFLDMEDDKVITPPLPTFKSCELCNVQYLNSHECGASPKTCSKCNKKYDSTAYKLHAIHHKYLNNKVSEDTEDDELMQAELIQKYDALKSTWNIIYKCSRCNMATDAYDRAVDHSQKHITDSLLGAARNCEICRITFDDISIKKHREWHSNESVNKSSFNVLNYNPSDLLTDNWLKLFSPLSEIEIKHITAPSIYVTRAVKMNLILNGPPDFSIYKCETCKSYEEPSKVFDHAHSCDGTSSPRSCNVCGIPFSSPTSLKSHQAIHKNSNVTANSYRIIAFNSKADKDFNKDLKDAKHAAEVRKDVRIEKKVTIYQCRKCNCGSLKSFFLNGHVCSNETLWTCPKCDFVTPAKKKEKHMKWHSENKNITKRNLHYVFFDCKGSDGRRYWFQCQRCDLLLSSDAENHNCELADTKICEKCDLKFTLRTYFKHQQEHAKYKKFSKDKMIIIPLKPKDSMIEVIDTSEVDKVVYKCDCGLHFTSERTLQKHEQRCSPNLKVSSENCSKCGLLFPTDLLVSHLCSHHSNANSNIVVKQRPTDMYRCAGCRCVFLSKPEFLDHFKNRKCNTKNGVKCDKCDLRFHQQTIKHHLPEHDSKEKIQRKILTLAKNNKHTLYKCKDCGIHIFTKPSYARHIKICNKKATKGACKFCGLLFTVASLQIHIDTHHRIPNVTAADFQVINYNEFISKELNPYEVDETAYTVISTEFVIFNTTKETEKIIEKETEEPEYVLQEKRGTCTFKNVDYDVNIYKCWCGLHFLTENSLRDHCFHTVEHFNARHARKTCPDCGYFFSVKSLHRHRKVHHQIMKLRTEDLVVLENTAFYGNAVTPKNNDLKTNLSDENMIYQCEKCSLHFLSVKNLRAHYMKSCVGKFEPHEGYCMVCEINFTEDDLEVHKDLHHYKMKYTIDDLHIFTFGSIQSNSTIQATENQCENNESKLILKPKSNNLTTERSDENTLYQCRRCQLYFIKEITGRTHYVTSSRCAGKVEGEIGHCDACNIDFTTNDLKLHKNQHHENLKYTIDDFHILTIGKDLSDDEVEEDEMSKEYENVKKKIEDSAFVVPKCPKTYVYLCKPKRTDMTTNRTEANSLFQCESCQLCFVREQAAKTHYNQWCTGKIETNEGYCDKCDLHLAKSAIKTHQQMHHLKLKYTLDDLHIMVVGTSEVPPDDTEETLYTTENTNKTTDRKLYKCRECNVHYLEHSSLEEHRAGNHKEEKKECDMCNLLFTNEEFTRHSALHHEEDLKREDFEIVIDNEDASDDDTQESIVPETRLPSTAVFDKNMLDYAIYRCPNCNLSYVALASLYYHINHNHRVMCAVATCDDCGLNFTCRTLQVHRKQHHEDRNCTLKDLYIIDIPKHYTTEYNVVKGNRLYKCDICDAHFFGLSVLYDHILKEEHDKQKTVCSECGLVFISGNISKHISVHHKQRNMRLEDFKIQRYFEDPEDGEEMNCRPYDVSAASTSVRVPNVLDNTEVSDAESDNSKLETTLDKTDDDVIIVNQSINKRRRQDVSKNLDESAISQSSDSDSNKAENTAKKAKPDYIKLYKCGGCNVFFLNQTTCYKHVYKHTPMENWEYIECKLCALQFRVVTLARHVANHHDKDFDLSNVLVEEYLPKQAGEKTPKIDIYYAIDRVQSRLVSTTTDDDKVDAGRNTQEVSQSNIEERNEKVSTEMANVLEKDKTSDNVEKDDNISTSNEDASTSEEPSDHIKNIPGATSILLEGDNSVSSKHLDNDVEVCTSNQKESFETNIGSIASQNVSPSTSDVTQRNHDVVGSLIEVSNTQKDLIVYLSNADDNKTQNPLPNAEIKDKDSSIPVVSEKDNDIESKKDSIKSETVNMDNDILEKDCSPDNILAKDDKMCISKENESADVNNVENKSLDGLPTASIIEKDDKTSNSISEEYEHKKITDIDLQTIVPRVSNKLENNDSVNNISENTVNDNNSDLKLKIDDGLNPSKILDEDKSKSEIRSDISTINTKDES